jgi:hypothetical protein
MLPYRRRPSHELYLRVQLVLPEAPYLVDSLYLVVTPRGKGYVAESRALEITALGSSTEEAAENARLMAIALFAKGPRPSSLIVRFDEPGLHTILMQRIYERVSLAPLSEKPEWRYMAFHNQ